MAREKNPESPSTAKRAPRKRSPLAIAVTEQVAPRPSFVDPQQRAALISRAAYFRALNRGFVPGHEMEDWLAAEIEVDAELMLGTGAGSST